MTLVEEPAGAVARAVPELPKRLEPLALAAVRNAALAAYVWAGRGDGKAADGAATAAMREALGHAHVLGNVVIGEGEKDGA
ncbi:MAG: fructose,6-bisphosphatase, partial [bacterium]